MSKNQNDHDLISNSNLRSLEMVHEGGTVPQKPHFNQPLAPANSNKDLEFVLNGLRRWWKWSLPLGLLLGCGAALVVYLLFKPSYESMATLRITERPDYIAFENRAEPGKSFVKTQIELLRHPVVISPLLADPEIAGMPEIVARADPVKWLREKISVKPEGESELYDVKFAAGNPKLAQKVVKSLLDKYFELIMHEEDNRTDKVIATLKDMLGERALELVRLRNLVREQAKQAGGKDPFGSVVEHTVVANNPLADLQNHLAMAEVEKAVLQARIKAYKDAPKQRPSISDALIESRIDAHPQVLRAKQELAELQIEFQNLQAYSKKAEKNPASQPIVQQIQRSQNYLAQLRKDLQKQLRLELESATIAKRDEQMEAMNTDLDNKQIAIDSLQSRLDQAMKEAKQTSGDTLQLRLTQGELERAEKIHDLISDRIVNLSTEKQAPRRVYVIQPALLPTVPIEAFPYRNILLAALAGFSLPFGLAFGLEKLIHRVGDASSLESVSQIPVVAEIARLPSRQRHANRRVSQRIQPDLRMFEESINSLRTTLMLTKDLRDLRVLAVTSATTHEGKTSLAVQLSMSLAKFTRKPTLLIDGDMRSPNLHEIFEVPLGPGLSKVLGEQTPIAEAIVPTSCPGLDLLPAGKLTRSQHQLLNNEAMAALLQSFPEKYSYVIIDTPPVLAASESLIMSSMADATLVCALRDVSRIDQIKRAYQRLMTAGSKPVGLVLNGVPTRTYAYHYGSYAYENR